MDYTVRAPQEDIRWQQPPSMHSPTPTPPLAEGHIPSSIFLIQVLPCGDFVRWNIEREERILSSRCTDK